MDVALRCWVFPISLTAKSPVGWPVIRHESIQCAASIRLWLTSMGQKVVLSTFSSQYEMLMSIPFFVNGGHDTWAILRVSGGGDDGKVLFTSQLHPAYLFPSWFAMMRQGL